MIVSPSPLAFGLRLIAELESWLLQKAVDAKAAYVNAMQTQASKLELAKAWKLWTTLGAFIEVDIEQHIVSLAPSYCLLAGSCDGSSATTQPGLSYARGHRKGMFMGLKQCLA